VDSRPPSVDIALNDLVGRVMTSVIFVMDYLQITFDDAWLTVISSPTLITGGKEVGWKSPDFADVLRRQIGKALRRVDVSNRQARLTFETGCALSIPLEEDPPRVEYLILEKDGKRIWVA
jgi:hypothetical protein